MERLSLTGDVLSTEYPTDFSFDPSGDRYVLDRFTVSRRVLETLFPFQRIGVAWMWHLFRHGKGGILADEMGVGKTRQVVSFISGLLQSDLATHILIIVPQTLLQTWTGEFGQCGFPIGNDSLCVYHGSKSVERQKAFSYVKRKGGICLTTYGLIRARSQEFCDERRSLRWDQVILDEGDQIRNPSSKISHAVREIPAKCRLILSGTPIQNNLREYWALIDFVTEGSVLGSQKQFRAEFEVPILQGRYKNATERQKLLSQELATSMRTIIGPYFLRREKEDVFDIGPVESANDQASAGGARALSSESPLESEEGADDEMRGGEGTKRSLVSKSELIVWVRLAPLQLELYRKFLDSEEVRAVLMSKVSPLVAIRVLQRICDHPRLLLTKENESGFGKIDLRNEFQRDGFSGEVALTQSCKIAAAFDILKILETEGKRVLLFSFSLEMLDMCEIIAAERNYRYARLDGSTKHAERQELVDRFNRDPSIFLFLLSIKVGGLGLTLTGADRAILLEPGWNPSIQAQAVDRIHRVGQLRDVVTYRLISCGTIEEKIYRKMLLKNAIVNAAFHSRGYGDRLFTKEELTDLFRLDDPDHSETHARIASSLTFGPAHSTLQAHIESVLGIAEVVAVSDHRAVVTSVGESVSASSSDSDVFDHAASIVDRYQKAHPEDSKKFVAVGGKDARMKTNWRELVERRRQEAVEDGKEDYFAEQVQMMESDPCPVSQGRVRGEDKNDNAGGDDAIDNADVFAMEETFGNMGLSAVSLNESGDSEDQTMKDLLRRFRKIRPAAEVDEGRRSAFNFLLTRVEKIHETDPMTALSSLLDALDICDDDDDLHILALWIARRLVFWNETFQTI